MSSYHIQKYLKVIQLNENQKNNNNQVDNYQLEKSKKDKR